jgi:FtsZ-interacting cell division protein YlmF
MGIWQKTLFYLGLVDEDDPNSYRDPSAGMGQPMPQQRREPVAERARVDTGRRAVPQQPQQQVQQRPEVAVRRTPTRRVEPPMQDPTFDPLMPSMGGGVQGRRVEPPMSGRRRQTTSADSALAEAGVVVRPPDTPLVRTVSDADLESEVIVATSYSDAQLLADHIRSTIPVVLDLRKVEPAMVRRLVDFASGLTYALGGSMRKIGQGVILVTPQNVNLSRDERRRLRELGYYQAPDEG